MLKSLWKRVRLWYRTGIWVRRQHGVMVARRGNASMGMGDWNPVPTKIKGRVRVQYSRNGEFYYLPDYCQPDGFWLSVDTQPTTKESQRHGIFAGTLQITKDDGTCYVRRYMPFRFWDVRSGKTEQLPMASDLVLDYLVRIAAQQESATKRFEDFCCGRN